MCSNNIITKILGISDKNLKIISSDYKNIKGIRYMVINAQITYIPKVCTKCGCINEKYSIVKNGNKTHYVINSIKYSYTNAVVEGKNNMIKVFKRISFGFRSHRNMRARILLRERFEIK